MQNNLAKRLVTEFLDYMKFKVDNDLLTMEEVDSIAKAIEEKMNIIGTVEDFAKFCKVSEANVRHVINRKVLDKPKRRVYYRFIPFIKNIPNKWLKDK